MCVPASSRFILFITLSQGVRGLYAKSAGRSGADFTGLSCGEVTGEVTPYSNCYPMKNPITRLPRTTMTINRLSLNKSANIVVIELPELSRR
jgi:hypothetical protein